MRYALFLRAINVAGHQTVTMENIKGVHESLGHQNIASVLQTGNILFDSELAHHELLTAIQAAYAKQLGLKTDLILKSAEQLTPILNNCPYQPSPKFETKFIHCVFLSDSPTESAIKSFYAIAGPEKAQVVDDMLYVYYTDGAGRSKLTLKAIEKALDVKATARNINTVSKILAKR